MRNFFLNLDPGWVSFRMAFRGTMTVALCLAASYALGSLLGYPLLLGMTGIAVSMMASIAISDPKPQQQKITFLLAPFACVAALAFGTGIHASHSLVIAFLLVLTFFSVALRKYGPRGRAIGTLAFMSYFNSIFLPIPFDRLWISALHVFLAFAIAYAVRFHLFPERPHRVLNGYLEAFEHRTRSALDRLKRELAQPDPRSGVYGLITNDVPRINDLILEIDQFLVNQSGAIHAVFAAETQFKLFEIEMAVRETFAALWRELQRGPFTNESRNRHAEAIQALLRLPFPPAKAANSRLETTSPTADPPPPSQPAPSHLRIAIQTTLAMALAAGLGLWLSPTRWYWAAITAFFVLVNASRADTLTRAALRTLGTAAGLAFGLWIAGVLGGFRDVELAVLFACVFTGLYGFRWAYGFWSAASFSILIALLFHLMGMMSQELLLLRLEETAVGALAGALGAFFVFPSSTHRVAQDALVRLLKAVSTTLQAPALPEVDGPTDPRIIRKLRSIDRELAHLRNLAHPYTAKFAPVKSPLLIGVVHDAAALAHYARTVTLGFAGGKAAAGTQPACRELARHADELAEKLSREANPARRLKVGPTPMPSLPHAPPAETGMEHQIARAEQFLESLEERLLA